MSTRIPTSTSVLESAVIEAHPSNVWHLIKLQDFSKFWSALSTSEFVKGASPDTDIVKWSFKDGTVLEVKQEEHSVCCYFFTRHKSSHLALRRRQANHISNFKTIDHFITYSTISSQPALSYSSVVSTVRCFPITSGKHEGHTFVSWSGNFSSDADAGKPLTTGEDLEFSQRYRLF